jgi:hypothetical protein
MLDNKPTEQVCDFKCLDNWLAIALMMEAASTSEISINFYQITRRNIPEDSHLHTRCRENLKSYLVFWLFTRVSEEHALLPFSGLNPELEYTAFISGVNPEGGGSMFHRNVGMQL